MSELDKNKAGLQKKVSSVFKGVPVPQNNNSRQTPGTPAPEHAPNVTPKPAPADKKTSGSSLISRLSQPEDTPNDAGQSQTANAVQKPESANKMPQSSLANKIPQTKGSLKRTAQPSEGAVLIEESNDGLWQQIKDKLFASKLGAGQAKQKAMVIMIPVLAIIMIFAFRQVLSKSPRKTKGTEADNTPIVSKKDTGHEIDWVVPEPIKIVTMDPVQIPDESNTQNENQSTEQNGTANTENQGVLIIKDIVYSKDKPSAVIGSRIVYIGDTVNGMTVIKIDQDSVEFEKDGERWEQNVRNGKMIPISDSAGQGESRPESIE